MVLHLLVVLRLLEVLRLLVVLHLREVLRLQGILWVLLEHTLLTYLVHRTLMRCWSC